jgi:hypothetical protein
MQRLVLGTILIASACGPSDRTGNNGQPDAAVVQPDGTITTEPDSRVYAHSGSKLYRVDTATLQPIEIGTMTGLGVQSLTDLAIDKSDRMFGVTLDKLYTINSTTGATTLVTMMSVQGNPSLSFMPMDLNNPASDDILVTANDMGDVYKIDQTSGSATKIGSYGTFNNKKVVSSGDLIAVRGFGIYATVDVGTESQDYLARIDPANNYKATPIGGGTGYDKIFGLGYWKGTIYGFVSGSSTGQMITIDPATGAATEVQSGSVSWFGAGVATNAPILQ